MLNAMLNVIVTEKLYDEQYIADTRRISRHCNSDSCIHAEKMAPVCGMRCGNLREVARLTPVRCASIIFWGMGISQQSWHGQFALPNRAGAHDGSDRQARNGPASPTRPEQCAGRIRFRPHPDGLSDYQSGRERRGAGNFEKFWGQSLVRRRLTVVEIMRAVHAGEIKGMFVEGENPAMSDPDLNHARHALAMLEHLVVQDLFLTETAFHADVVLPASAFAEKVGTFTNTDRRVQMGRPVIPPPGDARQDWWIIQEIAKRMGLDWNYEGPAEVFAEMAQMMPSLNNITWERVERETRHLSVDAPDKPGNEIVSTRIPTEVGAENVPANIVPPDEVPDAQYPMVLSTGRVLEHWQRSRRAARMSSMRSSLRPSPQDTARDLSSAWSRRHAAHRDARGAVEVKIRADR